MLSSSSFFHRSMFLTGCLLAVFQPFFFQLRIHCVMPFLTYWLSVWISMGSSWLVMARRPSMQAWSSIWLLVVFGEEPDISFSWLLNFKTTPQPPFMEGMEHAPSVYMRIFIVNFFNFVGFR